VSAGARVARKVPLRWVAAAVAALVLVAVAVLATSSNGGPPTGSGAGDESWDEVVATAEGQTVRLWMWGGEMALNDHIDRDVAPRAAELGITVERVPIDDTADAISRIAAEVDAGDDSGAVDLVWVNGANFAQGKDAGLWLGGWTSRLPSADYLDPDDPTLQTDFGVPVDGQELPWSRAAFVFAHDTGRLEDPPRSFEELADFVEEHPGRVTYPAPPDFTGSAFVRQAVQALGEDEALALLADMEPQLWQGGRNHPVDQAELDRLFAAGEVDVAMSYNPSFVDTAVRAGRFPDTVRPYVFDGGTLQNVSFLAIPANAAHPEGAQVVADLLVSPELQAAKLKRVGIPTVVDLDRLDNEAEDAFDDGGEGSPHLLDDLGPPLEELPVDEVARLDQRWLDEVAR
jgi:putative spermidine/putrescine transport system substrate-binding protein